MWRPFLIAAAWLCPWQPGTSLPRTPLSREARLCVALWCFVNLFRPLHQRCCRFENTSICLLPGWLLFLHFGAICGEVKKKERRCNYPVGFKSLLSRDFVACAFLGESSTPAEPSLCLRTLSPCNPLCLLFRAGEQTVRWSRGPPLSHARFLF